MSFTDEPESVSDAEFDPLSTQEEFLVPVAVTASEVGLASCLALSWLS
jgi:hypothetical protein